VVVYVSGVVEIVGGMGVLHLWMWKVVLLWSVVMFFVVFFVNVYMVFYLECYWVLGGCLVFYLCLLV